MMKKDQAKCRTESRYPEFGCEPRVMYSALSQRRDGGVEEGSIIMRRNETFWENKNKDKMSEQTKTKQNEDFEKSRQEKNEMFRRSRTLKMSSRNYSERS